MVEVRIIGVEGLPLLKPGDDLAAHIVERASVQGVAIEDGDILVIGQKAVSKTEGRILRLRDIKPSQRARRFARRTRKDPRLLEAILGETRRVLKAERGIIIVETRSGVTCLNGGLDKSNVEGDDAYGLLPRDPNRSALLLRERLMGLTGRRLSVIICDTYSRPFRAGQVEFAIGLAGLDPIDDYRGSEDLFGYRLRYKYIGLADEIAAAAELVMGQGAEGIPVAIIKGLRRAKSAASRKKGSGLFIAKFRDLFRGTL